MVATGKINHFHVPSLAPLTSRSSCRKSSFSPKALSISRPKLEVSCGTLQLFVECIIKMLMAF